MYPQQVVRAAKCNLVKAALDYYTLSCYFKNTGINLKGVLRQYLDLDCPEKAEIKCLDYKSPSCQSLLSLTGAIDIEHLVVHCSCGNYAYNYVDYSPRGAIVLQNDAFEQYSRFYISNVSESCGVDGPENTVTSTSFTVSTVLKLIGLKTYPNGFIYRLKVYTSPTNSVLLDVSPSTASFWSSCSTCVPVNPSDLVFGAASYNTEFKKHLENVAMTVTGLPLSDAARIKVEDGHPVFDTVGTIYLKTAIKHGGTNFFVINPTDTAVSFSTGLIGDPPEFWYPVSFNPFVSYLLDNVPVYTSPGSVSNPCVSCNTSTSYIVTTQHSGTLLDHLTTTFSNIALGNRFTGPITLSPTSSTCTQHRLTAVIHTPGNVTSKGWYDSSDTLLTTSNILEVTTSGTYTFKFTSDAFSHTISKSITIP